MEASMPNPTDHGALNAYIHPNQTEISAPEPGTDKREVIEQLNSFLRGEISAAETYRMVMEKLIEDHTDPGHVSLLREIQTEHGRAAKAIRDRIRDIGGESVDSAGPWGAWAKFAMGTAEIFGDTAALKTLRDGEQHGLKDYSNGQDVLDVVSTELVRNQLMPAQQRHINLLDQIINLVGS